MSVGCKESQDIGIGGVGTGLDSLSILLQNLVVSFVLTFFLVGCLGFAEILYAVL